MFWRILACVIERHLKDTVTESLGCLMGNGGSWFLAGVTPHFSTRINWALADCHGNLTNFAKAGAN